MAHPQHRSGQAFPRFPQHIQTTLLDLVWAVSQVTSDDRLVAATVAHLVNSGRARLTGTFKGTRLHIG